MVAQAAAVHGDTAAFDHFCRGNSIMTFSVLPGHQFVIVSNYPLYKSDIGTTDYVLLDRQSALRPFF